MRIGLAGVGLLAVLTALPAAAQDQPSLRPLCGSRPGLGTPPCILDKGHVQVEVGLFAAQRDTVDRVTAETLAFGSTEVIYGIDGINQLALVFAPFNSLTVTDRDSGRSERFTGVGDIALRWRHSLRNPDGEGFSVAIEALVNIAVGRQQLRSYGWGAGLLVPFSFPLTDSLSVIAAPGFIWSENLNSAGQHIDYTGSFGLSQAIGDFGLTIEGGYTRNGEPDSGRDSLTFAASLAWSPPGNDNLQFDAGVSAGATDPAPDVQAYIGVVRRF